MSHDCCFVSNDGENGPEVFSYHVRKACKPYKCCECGDVIAAGESHEYASGRWEGDWNSHRTCLGCVDVRDAFSCGYTYTMFWLELLEQDIPLGALDKLSALGLAKFSKMVASREPDLPAEEAA